MSMAQDLMGIGVSPLQAAHGASGGTGPLFISTGTTSAFSTSTRIGAYQFVCSMTGGASTTGIALPQVGGDNGALLADDFIINNQGTTTVFLFASSGVTISVGGSNTSFTQVGLHTTMTCYPLSQTQWIGVKGS